MSPEVLALGAVFGLVVVAWWVYTANATRGGR
jgi:hypothetical protein